MPSRKVVIALVSSVVVVTTGVVAGVLIYGDRQQKKARRLQRGFKKLPSLWDIEDFEDEGEADEPEPADLQYADDDVPCRLPEHPWQMTGPVSYGPLVGADSGGYCMPPADLAPAPKTEVAFAGGAKRPGWPLDTSSDERLKVSYKDVKSLFHGRWGREFGATRKSKDDDGREYKRVHVGMDLFAEPGDVVYATEPGEVVATLPFYKGTGAVYVKHDSGLIVNYGEIEKGSWKDFGVKTGIGTGQRVEQGQPIARVGVSDDGSHMLHLETYQPYVTVDEIRKKKMRWYAGDSPPVGVLDPTLYLVRARQVAYEDRLAAELASEQT